MLIYYTECQGVIEISRSGNRRLNRKKSHADILRKYFNKLIIACILVISHILSLSVYEYSSITLLLSGLYSHMRARI